MKKIFALLLMTAFLAGIITSCKKDKGDPPTLPPVESMAIDFSNFESGKKSADVSLPKGIENSDWEFVADRAQDWSYVLYTILAVPVASFKLAINEAPAYIEDKTWQWSYDAKILNYTYKARLTGQIRASDVLWKMYVALNGTGGFPEFLWFEGTSELDGTGGVWTLYHSHTFQEPVLKIEWTGTSNKVETIKYTYVRTFNDSRVADPFKNSFIEYGKKTGTYDAYYTIYYYNGSGFSDVNVEWSTTGHNGRVKCSAFFNDAYWHCWDGNYVNITCP